MKKKLLKHFYTSEVFYEKVKELKFNIKSNEYAIVTMDFDNFNYVNDLFGYEVGDNLLDMMAACFDDMLDEGEMFARIHADHFNFWVKVTEEPITDRFYKITDIDKKIEKVLPIHYSLVASGGIIVLQDKGESIPALLDKANFARKRAKSNHISHFVYYSNVLADELIWKKRITVEMEKALEQKEFEMYLQPKVVMKTKQIAGSEALVRWNSKKYGMIYPDHFISVFEQNGFIRKLDFFVLHQACSFLEKSKLENNAVLPISVNFSKIHLRFKNFAEEVYKVVQKYHISPYLIEIELTENVFADDINDLIRATRGLKNFGFKVSLDDFGKAYSSLNYLKDVPLDLIKIDKGFLNVTSDIEKSNIMIAKIIDMIKALHLTPVMEGIETKEQAEFLQKLNCDLGQGYYFARPMQINDYEKLISHSDILKIAEKDISTQELQERGELYLKEQWYNNFFKQSDSIIFEWDFNKKKILISEKYKKITGSIVLENITDISTYIQRNVHIQDIKNVNEWMKEAHINIENSEVEFRIWTQKKKYEWLKMNCTPILDEKNRPIKVIGLITNTTKEKEELETLIQEVHIDPLTRIYHKDEMKRRVEVYLKENPDKRAAFFMIDIDDFKGVNDSLGHQFGDSILQEVTQKIKRIFKEEDIMGRLGGDEIGVLLCDAENDEELKSKAELLNQILKGTYFATYTKYSISVSIGISKYPEHGNFFNSLYQMADVALLEAKHIGKNCYRIYHENMGKITEENRTPVEREERFLNAYFAEDIIFHIFEMLYETKDIATSIQLILEQLGNRFEVDRVYIFESEKERNIMNNTYEWCRRGISSEKGSLQNLSLEKFADYFAGYDKEGMLKCTDISEVDNFSFTVLERQGIQSFLHCGIYDRGEIAGFIGFDDCMQKRLWKGEEIATLGYISRILSVFLIKQQTLEELSNSYKHYVEMLDNLNGHVYVIDRNNYELLYINNAMKKLNAKLGQKCYEVAFQEDKPCENCPVKKLSNKIKYATEEIYSLRLDLWVNSAASRLLWNGEKDAALVCCTDISKYK